MVLRERTQTKRKYRLHLVCVLSRSTIAKSLHQCRPFSHARLAHRNSLGESVRICRQTLSQGWRDSLKATRLSRAIGFCPASGQNRKGRPLSRTGCEEQLGTSN